MFEMDVSGLRTELDGLKEHRRALQRQAETLEQLCGKLPQGYSTPALLRCLSKMQQDLTAQADQALQLCRALEHIVQRTAETEAGLARQPDAMKLTVVWPAPEQTRLELETQTQGVDITW